MILLLIVLLVALSVPIGMGLSAGNNSGTHYPIVVSESGAHCLDERFVLPITRNLQPTTHSHHDLLILGGTTTKHRGGRTG